MYDKSTVLIILGSLIKKPSIFLDKKYNITEEDFVERFHTIIFAAIKNLFLSGVQTITALEIDTYLSNYAVQKKIFDDNNGIQYVDNLIKFAKVENFDFHYNILKKYTLLRKLREQGIDVSCFIDENIVDPKKIEEMMTKFNSLTINDILNQVETRLVSVKDEFYRSNEVVELQAGENLHALLDSFKISPEMGLPIGGEILNTICRGARRTKLYLVSSPTGTFKSRGLIEKWAKVAVPEYYNVEQQKWIYTGFNEPTLYITTELTEDEVQTALLATVSGIPEDKILDYNYTIQEAQRRDKALKIIENSKMYIVRYPNYSSQDIERTIKKYNLLYGVNYIYFDYVFTTPKLIEEGAKMSRGVSVREDNILLLFMTKLKDLCNELDVHISTCTQVSNGWQNSKYPDSSLLRACKALSDKVDIGIIGLPVSKEEIELLQPLLSKGLYPNPNLCYHIYKVRRGKYNKIRLYMYFDGGTCQTRELFATNENGEYLEIKGTNIENLERVLNDTTVNLEQVEQEAEILIKEEDYENSSADANNDIPF